jgi:hypothetical protein
MCDQSRFRESTARIRRPIPRAVWHGKCAATPSPTFFCKSIIPGRLFLESCKDVILRGLAQTIRQGHFSSNLPILMELGWLRRFSSRLSALALCKSIIPDDLLHDLRKSIILSRLGLTGFRLGHSQTVALDLARSECLPAVSLENMTCASVSAWSP